MKKQKQRKGRWMLIGGIAALGAAAAAGAYWKKKQDEPYQWYSCSCKEPEFPEHMAAPTDACCCDDGEEE